MAEMTPEEIKTKKPYLEWGLTQKEYDYICDELLQRLPNYTETGLFSVMWSEHCSYKKSKPVLRLFPTKNERVLQGPGEGAGIVDIGDGLAVVLKLKVIIILLLLNPTKVQPLGSVGSCAIFLVWVRALLPHLTHYILAN